MTPVEAVARELCKTDCHASRGAACSAEKCGAEWWSFTDDAKAAIRALAENVTDEMALQIEAAECVIEKRTGETIVGLDPYERMAFVRAAILAAMEDE